MSPQVNIYDYLTKAKVQVTTHAFHRVLSSYHVFISSLLASFTASGGSS